MFVFTAEVIFTPGDASLDVRRASYELEGSLRLKNADGQQLLYTTATVLPMCKDCPAARGRVKGIRKCERFRVDGNQLLQTPTGQDRIQEKPVQTTLYLHSAGGWSDDEWPPMLPCARDTIQQIPVVTRPFSY